jgi:NAD(P)-dependent dehydrogenase (short-subunit alcohol dehydrogenase family)
MEDGMTGRLAGKSAIVTGAASGIGRASALLFAREGARLLIADRAEEGLNQTLEMIQKAGHAASALAMDAGNEDDVKKLVATAIHEFGRIDAVYANAGVSGGLTSLLEIDVANFMEILRINTIGPYLAIKHAAPHMIRQGAGSIVMTASVAALRANAGNVAYSASKAGVISLAQTAANALIGTGVRVNAVCPGLIETGMTRPIFEQARARGTDGKIGQLNPLQRAGRPEEIAAMALFLASDEASYVNGQAFPVDGGLSSTHPFAKPRK